MALPAMHALTARSLERYEERFGMTVPDLRAIALALAYTRSLTTPEMFVGPQRDNFLRNVRKAAAGDVYLSGALYLLDDSRDGATDRELKLTDADFDSTEDLLFVGHVLPPGRFELRGQPCDQPVQGRHVLQGGHRAFPAQQAEKLGLEVQERPLLVPEQPQDELSIKCYGCENLLQALETDTRIQNASTFSWFSTLADTHSPQVPGVQDALIHQQAEPAASNAFPIDAGVILPGELPIAVQAALDVLLAHVLAQTALEQRNVLARLQGVRQRIPLPVHDVEAAEHRAVGVRQQHDGRAVPGGGRGTAKKLHRLRENRRHPVP